MKQPASTPENKPFASIRSRFLAGLSLVVTVVICCFLVVMLWLAKSTLEKDLHSRLDHLTRMSAICLASPALQPGAESREAFLDSLFVDEDLLFITIESGSEVVLRKMRPGSPPSDFRQLLDAGGYIVQTADITQGGTNGDRVSLAFSRQRLDRLVAANTALIAASLLFLLITITAATSLLSKRYIFAPLAQLEKTAREAAEGHCGSTIAKKGNDEIGRLAGAVERMKEKLRAVTASRDELELQIDEERRAEKALQDMYQTMDLAQKMAGVGYWSYDRRSRRRSWSRQMFKVFSLKAQATPPDTAGITSLFHADDRAPYERAFNRALEGIPYRLVSRIVAADGRVRYINTQGYPQYDENGRVTGVFGISQDISEQKEAEEALRQSEEKYRNIFENAIEGFFRSTREGRFEEVNPAFARMLGYDSPGELIASITDIASEYYVDPADRQKYQQLLEEKGAVIDMEFKVRRRDGSEIWISNSTRACYDSHRRITHYEGIVNDINERKQAEAERRKLQDELQQARKMESIGTLAGGIAHDFNNILASIIGFTELALEDAPKNTELQDSLEEVLAAANRARELVLQILTFARKRDSQRQPVAIKSVAREALRFLRSTIPSSVEIQQDLRSDALVLASKTEIYQLFFNICSNGAQAMEPEGGLLQIKMRDRTVSRDSTAEHRRLAPEDTCVEITITDSGPGIAEEHRGSIFEPYFTTKGLGEGTGLGLAVVHGIVTSYGGDISVESAIGRGSVFTILLPTVEAGPQSLSVHGKDLPPPAAGSERILLVDDEQAIVTMMSRMLTGLGYHVSARTSSSEALELFLTDPQQFDLLITDMTMPQMNGDRLAEKILEARSDIPIILCTGYNRGIDREKAFATGIDGFLNKPIDRAELAQLVRVLLDTVDRG